MAKDREGPFIQTDSKGNSWQGIICNQDTDRDGNLSNFFTGFVELGNKLYRLSTNLTQGVRSKGKYAGTSCCIIRVHSVKQGPSGQRARPKSM